MLELFLQVDFAEYLRILAEIVILTIVIFRFYSAIAETKATQLFGILIVTGLIFGFAYVFKLTVIETLIKQMIIPFGMMLVVFYHPELRRAFSSSFSRKRFFRIGNQNTADQLDSILNACNILVEKKRGALIVFPRNTDIKQVLDSGTKLNADLSSTLILTIFDHDTPLHDGACVIQNGRITYAACYLPLSEQTGIKATFGTRHRAALGLSEESDAIIIVVSEETGAISLVYNANIYYDLETETIKNMLLVLFSARDGMTKDLKEGVGENVE